MTAEIEGFIADASSKRGIDPPTSIRVARSEGGVDLYCNVGVFNTGWSFWPFQIHYGGPGYEYYGTVAGMGTGFTKLTGWQPETDEPWRDSIRYALNRAKASGWGAWYGAAAVGISQWQGIDKNHPWDANAERWDYEQAPLQDLTYNSAQPPERQVQDWTCSIRTTAWMLKSLGLPVDIAALQDEMSPRYVNSDVGLKDGTGAGLAEVIKAHLPASWHHRVHVYERINWNDLWKYSGTGPIGIGLHGAYHWIAVAAPQSDGSLISPNPAPKYPVAAPIGDILTSDEFNLYGPVSAVYVDARMAAGEADPPNPSDPFAKWRGHVGSGLIDMMVQDNTLPAQRSSTWLPLGVTPSDIESCAGQNGLQYSWQLTTGQGFRYLPKV